MRRLDIARALRGERIFITGATGFLGKVLVEKLLWSVPDLGRLVLLVRPDGERGAGRRLREEILGSPIMARLRALHAEGWEAWAAAKVEAVAGDLARDRFGLDEESYTALARRVHRVVASAATVTFDERLDRALALNARGALRTLELARDAGDVPLLHVSTCFVSGRRSGRVEERIAAFPAADAPGDPEALLERLEEACGGARDEDGAGELLVAAGAEAADRYGFHDVYTLTKALGERLLESRRGGVPLAIVRPAIVESALAEPIPGWIDAVRVTDPLLVAYGRGRVRTFAGSPGSRLEIVPVDHVVNAMIAALADLPAGRPGDVEPHARAEAAARPGAAAADGSTPREEAREPIPVYQVGSSRHPIDLERLLAYAREGFAASPLRDEKDRPIGVRPARFVAPSRHRRRLRRRRAVTGRLARWLLGTPLGPRLARAARALDHFARLERVYGPYLEHAAIYDDRNTRRLWSRLSAAGREAFPFDVAALDWRAYVSRVHVPGLVRFALRAEGGAPLPPRRDDPVAILHRRGEYKPARAENLFELFATAAAADPDAVAFQTCREGRWLRYRYRQALATTANVAHRMAERYGVGRGDRVILWGSGSPEWALASFAVHRLGAVTVPLDPQWSVDDVIEAVRLTGAKLVCAAPDQGNGRGLGCPRVELAAPFVPEPEVDLLPGVEPRPSPATPEDLAFIIFTSGTTVAPKAVPLTHGNLLANVRDLVPLMRASRERLLSLLPVHHVFELTVGMLVPLAGVGTVSYVAKIEPQEISWMMGATRPTMLVAVPRLLELLHNGIRRSVESGGPALRGLFRVLFALSSATGGRFGHRLFGKVHRRFGGRLRRIATGGSALEPELGESFGLMGFQVAEGYGMTETSPVLTVNPWDGIRLGTAGRPLPGVEIELRPVAGEPPGSGEIWVRGANVMGGYYQNPDASREVLRDGWLDTGDIGRFDEDGYLTISGRTKDLIVTAAGKNVYPEEVEARYRDLPAVEELVVLGLPDGAGGERVSAVVVPRAGASEEEIAAIRDAVEERSAGIPSYQRIGRVEIWRGDLPKTTTLKVKRARLREAVLAGEGAEEKAPSRGGRPSAEAVPGPAAAARTEAQTSLLAVLARLTRARPEHLRPRQHLSDLGVDSLTRVELLAEIEALLDRTIDSRTARSIATVGDLLELPASLAGGASEATALRGAQRKQATAH